MAVIPEAERTGQYQGETHGVQTHRLVRRQQCFAPVVSILDWCKPPCTNPTGLFKLPGGVALSSSSIRKHAGTGAASDQPAVPEPSFAERARTLVYLARIGSLSTLSRKQPGFPFGSVMPYGLDEHGRPIFLISTMAMHTHNLRADPRASLLVTQPDASGDPLGASRVTLMGNVLPIPEPKVEEARRLYLARYANSQYWVDFEDFSFY